MFRLLPFSIQFTRIKKQIRKKRSKRIRTSYKQYDETNFQAIIAVRSKTMSIRKAANIFQVPCSSLHLCIQQQCTFTHSNSNSNNNSQLKNQLVTNDSNYLHCIHTILTIDANAEIEVKLVYSSYTKNVAPQSTIILKSDHSGPSTIMTYEEEKAFCNWIITCSELHIPTPKSICNQKASMILERRGSKFKTKTGLPSKEWWYGFYKRWPQVAPRKPQPLSKGKALLTKEHVDAFFTDLHSLSNTVATEVNL